MEGYNGKNLCILPFPKPESAKNCKVYKWNILFSRILKKNEKKSIERLFSSAYFVIDNVKYNENDAGMEFLIIVPVGEDKNNQLYSFEFWLFTEINRITSELKSIQGLDKKKWPYFRFTELSIKNESEK